MYNYNKYADCPTCGTAAAERVYHLLIDGCLALDLPYHAICPRCGQEVPARVVRYKQKARLERCGHSCRHASNDVCHCECGGKNHGVER